MDETLLAAVLSKNQNSVRQILAAGVDPNQKSSSGTPVLHYAASKDSLPIVKLLLEAGANPNLESPDGGTALLCASGLQSDEIVKALVAAGAAIDAKYKDGDTINALMIAAKRGSLRVIQFLIASGLDVKYRSRDGVTALHFSIIDKDQPKIAAELIKFGADVNAKTKLGHTPLKYAMDLKREQTIRTLVEFGANL